MDVKYFNVPFLLILIFVFASCNLIGNNDTEVEIRVKNSSNYTIENLRINTGGGDYTYETLSPGQISSYKTYEYSYRYFYVAFSIDEQSFDQQPTDYVGESKIGSGQYTFDIDIETLEEHPINFTGQLNKN